MNLLHPNQFLLTLRYVRQNDNIFVQKFVDVGQSDNL